MTTPEGESPSQNGHLPDSAVVIRGGMMKRELLVASARRYADRHDGTHGISVFSWPGLDASGVALRAKEEYPSGRNPVNHG
jgi:hypothetical protein